MKVWDVCAKVKISMFAEFDIYIILVTPRPTPEARLRIRSAERKVKLGLFVSAEFGNLASR